MNGFAMFDEEIIPDVLNVFNRHNIKVMSYFKSKKNTWHIDFEYSENTNIDLVMKQIEKVQNAHR